jgi:protein O-mannosyl-transferase
MQPRTDIMTASTVPTGRATQGASHAWARVRRYRLSNRETALALVLAIVAVFAHGLYNEFVQWDDPINLIDNKNFRGLGWTQLRWMFSATLMGHYIPVTWLTFGLDYTLWGMESGGYHFTNLVLHAANVVMFFLLAMRLLSRALPWATTLELRAGAALSALFFGVHPLRAESVAWVTERRDVLSGLMFLACVLCYVSATDREGWSRRRRLGGALVFFVLAVLSKSITMTLPAALLIIDIYPLRRLRLAPAEWLSGPGRRVLLEKVPFLIIAAIAARVSYWAVARHEFFTSTVQYPLPARLVMALYSVCFYIGKTILPVGLSALYELPPPTQLFEMPFLLTALATMLITVSLIGLSRKWSAGIAAYGYYAIVIAPVGGLVHAGHQLAHDRYSYLSCLGFALLVGGLPALLGRARERGDIKPRLARLATAAMIAWVVVLGTLTWDQVRVWRNTESLWFNAAFAEPECSICHNNVGAYLVNEGRVEAAFEHLNLTLQLRPERDKAHAGIGLGLIRLDRFREAEGHLKRALDKDQYDTTILNNLGISLSRQGKFAEAVPYLRRALVIDPANQMARANLAAALAGTGQLDAAAREFHHAAARDAFAVEPRVGLVRVYLQQGKRDEARKHYTILRQLHPKDAEPLAHLFAS